MTQLRYRGVITMKTKWMICLGIGAILAGAPNLVAQQSVFTKVKVRFNRSDKDPRLIDKNADLVLDDVNRRLIVKSDERPLEVMYENVEKVVFDVTTHMRGGVLSQVLMGAPAAVPVASGASVAGVALAGKKVSDYWFYLSYRADEGTKSYLMEVSRDSSDEIMQKAKAAFGDRVTIVDFPEKATRIEKKLLKDLQSKHELEIDKANRPRPVVNAGKALVVVVCPALAGIYLDKGNQVKLHANDTVVAVNKLGTYSFAYLDPGPYRLVSQAGNATAIDISLEAGKDYYFLQDTFMGTLKSATVLSRHSKELVLYELSGADYANWKRKQR
jgi:hypothetical protein